MKKLQQIGLLFLLLAPAAQADLIFLRPNDIDTRHFPAPPREGSAADAKDIDGVLRWQHDRTKQDCARATDEAGASLKSFYGMSHRVMSDAEITAVKSLYDDIMNDAGEFISPIKKHWARPRPFQRDSRVQICVPKVTGFSYPSGHSTLGRVTALSFGLIFPDRKNALLDRGDEVGTDRVIGGVHHPLDVEMGRKLGDQLFAALKKSPVFNQRIADLKRRLRRYRSVR
ncbi:MAG: phosphatase PAP2 family protein [Bdellovibrionales bacterium]|nr:phosphatase PAP2 family protein [Bdellovibrionales bacterium]